MARGLTLALALVACADNVADPIGATVPPPIVDPIEAELLVPGSILAITGDGFLSDPAGRTEVRLTGEAGGEARSATLHPLATARTQIQLVVDEDFASLFAEQGGRFVGEAQVIVRPGDQADAVTTTVPADLRFAPAIAPALESISREDIAPGAFLPVVGDGLLSAREGRSELHLVGQFTGEGGTARRVDALLTLHSRTDRRLGRFYLPPSVLSLATGVFDGRATLRTTSVDGLTIESPPIDLTLTQYAPRIDGLSPRRAARGQRLVLRGTGFVPVDPKAETATLVHAVGEFTPDGEPPEALLLSLVPEVWVDNREVRLAIRSVTDARGRLVGFGARPGTFDGEIWVELYDGFDRAHSDPPLPVSFTILGNSQHVYLRFLPGFREALLDFGLSGAEATLRARILAVCARDYAGLRVSFGDEPPSDWAEYVTVEIGGRDPNGRDLFGLDNTPTKDVGNVRLDELLGGRNAESAEAGNLPYGGVFLTSFLTLSVNHEIPAIIADPRFDEIFGPFSPALGDDADPYLPGDVLTGPRVAQLEAALDALANLVGSTITHEVGHALGLAAIDGEVHNPRDTDGGLMDRGADRPFAERAAIDGTPPARFLGPNRQYLETLFGD